MKTDLISKKLTPLKLSAKEASVFEKYVAEADKELAAFGEVAAQTSLLWKPPARPIYERIKCIDHTFVFKYDDKEPNILHIYSRHMTTPTDAINLFFNYDPIEDKERKRFANFSKTHGLYWFWRNEAKKVVMVISCFKRQPESSAKSFLGALDCGSLRN